MNESGIPLSVIIDEVYKNGNSNPDYIQALISFYSNPENIITCQEILTDSKSSFHLLFFASEAICRITNIILNQWTFQTAIELSHWCFQYVNRKMDIFDVDIDIMDVDDNNNNSNNDDIQANSAVCDNLIKVTALILRHFWKINNDKCMDEWNNIVKLFDQQKDWDIGLSYINEIHDTMMDSLNLEIVELFSKKNISTILALCYRVLKSAKQTSLSNIRIISGKALGLFEKCILDRKHSRTQFPQSSTSGYNTNNFDLNEFLLEKNLVGFFFEIFDVFTLPQALNCVIAIIEILSDIYIPERNMLKCSNGNSFIISQICNGLLNKFDLKKLSSNSLHEEINVNISKVTLIALGISSKLNFSTIQVIPNFKEFLKKIAKFTNKFIKEIGDSQIIMNLIFFWKNLESALRNDGNVEPKKLIASYGPEICINYINYLLNVASDINYDHLSLIDKALCQYIQPIQNFVMMNPNELCQNISSEFVNKAKEFEKIISDDLLLNENDKKIFERSMSIFIQIATQIVLIKPTYRSNAKDDPKIKFHSTFFSYIISILNLTEQCNLKNQLFPQIEMSCLHFISQFSNMLYGSLPLDSSLSKDLYRQLRAKRCLILSFPECQNYFFNRILFSTLRFYTDHHILIDFSIDIIHNNEKITPNKLSNFYEKIFPLEENFPFINRIEYKSLRLHFFSTLVSVIIRTNDQISFQCLFSNLHEKYQKEITKEDICFLAIDICGIFNETKNTHFFKLLFNWFISDHSDLFVNLLDEAYSNNIVINSILKMWKTITLSSPLKTKIYSSSINGIILFKKAASVLTSYLAFIQTLNPESLLHDNYKGIQYSVEIFQNLVSGEYVLFGAFKIYNDTVFIDLLNIFASTFHFLTWNEIFKYPHVLESIMHLFRSLVQNQMETLVQSSPALVHMILEYTEKSLQQNNEEICKSCFDTLYSFLFYFYDNDEVNMDENHEYSIQNYINQLENLHLILWNNILNNKNLSISIISDCVNLMLSLHISKPSSIKEYLLSKMPNAKNSNIEKFCDELIWGFSDSSGNQNPESISQIITMIIDSVKCF